MLEVLLILALVGIIAGIAIPVLVGVRNRAKVQAIIRTQVRLMQMSLEQGKLDRGSYPDGGAYTWSMIPGNIQYPGPNPLPAFHLGEPVPGYPLEFKLKIPNGSMTYVVQIRDPVQGNHYFQVDQNGAETSF